MKVFNLIIVAFVVSINAVYSQDIKASEVPSVISNKFQKEHPKAFDIEWEMDGSNYKVEFEIGQKDYEIWYSPSGTVVRKKEELTKNELPKAIQDQIKAEYSGYKVDDVTKITEGGKISYLVELDSFTKDLKVTFKDPKSK